MFELVVLIFIFQTAFTTQWALYLLANNAQEQQRVFVDIKKDLCNMESSLVRGSIRESMRLYPVAFLIGRPFAIDGVIENFEIPKQVHLENNMLYIQCTIYTSVV